ncbi:MAG: sulfite exporter TauE/SafE family protein [Solirubrobacteraceae bacterium]
MISRRTLVLIGIGSAAGVFSGLFGVGGGTVMVPLLVLAMGLDERRATSVSLGAIVIIAAAAVMAQGAYGQVRVVEGLLVGVPAIGGVLFGTWLQQRIPARRVSLLFAALLFAVAVSMVFGVEADPSDEVTRDAAHVAIAAVVGIAAGVAAGLLGIGGGALFVPALVLALGLSHVQAEATSLLAIVPVSLVGAWRQHRYGNLDIRMAGLLGLVAVPGSLVGVVLVNNLPSRVVQIAFACFLVFVASRLWKRGRSKAA